MRRLAWPNRLVDIAPFFDREPPEVSQLCRATLEHLHAQWSAHVRSWAGKYTDARLRVYAAAVREKAGRRITGDMDVFMFIDGVQIFCCRPDGSRFGQVAQQSVFSGHTRQHCLTWIGGMLPCGLFGVFDGPYAGARHDAGIFAETGLAEELHAELLVSAAWCFFAALLCMRKFSLPVSPSATAMPATVTSRPLNSGPQCTLTARLRTDYT
jgi:hypothetical protein